MSHMKVLVIGPDLEQQLAPYDENLEVEAYRDDSWNHEDMVASARRYFFPTDGTTPPQNTLPVQPTDRQLIAAYTDGDGYDIRYSTEGITENWTTYNPQSKWDYYVTGGRYNASFRIKPGTDPTRYTPSEVHWSERHGNIKDHAGRADIALAGDIDWDTSIAEAAAQAAIDWDKIPGAIAAQGIPAPTETWGQVRTRHGGDIAAARVEWLAHPWNVAARALGDWGSGHNDYQMGAEDPRATYIELQRTYAAAPYYAYVQDGEWHGRGDMGWFGMSSNEQDSSTWYAGLAKLIAGLPADTTLTTVDCHI